MSMQSNVPEWANIQPPGGERHMPVYLLLDTSSSMEGAAIEAVRRGVEQFQNEVARDSFARRVVKVGVITFASEARLVGDRLMPISEFEKPDLEASGVTRLDLAFEVLFDSMNRDSDVAKAVKGGQKGDWKPAVFVLTDGQPTDHEGNVTDDLWVPARNMVINRPRGQIKPSSIVAVGCGPNVVDDTLKKISTGVAFHIDKDSAAFVALFGWLSQSITASVAPGGNPDDPFANVPLPPDSGLIRIP
jgi:uncharacterized protein YegL